MRRFALGLLFVASCGTRENEPRATVAAIDRAFGEHHGAAIARSDGAFAVSLRDRRVTIPLRGDGPTDWRAAGGLEVEIARTQASDALAESVDGRLVYRGALSGGDLVVRTTTAGLEDFVRFERAPQVPALEYRLRLRGLAPRLLDDTLELVDDHGRPFLRVAPPVVIGADGVKRAAQVDVRGCFVDANPAPPWGRTFVVRDETCTFSVRWDASIPAPLIVDPEWLLASEMARHRAGHSSTLLADGRVLVAGGSIGTAWTSGAEIYDPSTRTWATTGSMLAGHAEHFAFAIGSDVLVLAGTSVERWSSSTGTFSAAAAMTTPRTRYGADRLTDGRVLVAGGVASSVELSSAEAYAPATNTWSAAGALPLARKDLAVGALGGGRALAMGGTKFNGSTDVNQYEDDLFDGAAWSKVGATSGGKMSCAPQLLPSGKLLLGCGGVGLFDPATSTWSSYPKTGAALYGDSFSVTSKGIVYVIGGSSGYPLHPRVPDVFRFDLATSTYADGPKLVVPRYEHRSTTLADDRILVTGGYGELSGELLSSVEVDDGGVACTASSECSSGFCVDGVCCDSACDGACEACDLPSSLGACVPTPNGSAPRGKRPACGDGACAGTCGGVDRTKCTNLPDATITCAAATCADATHAASARSCDGAGTCGATTSVDCGKYVCDTSSAICRTACATNADCATGYGCDGGTCRKHVLGASCSSGFDCESGACFDGTCCATSACEAGLRCDLGDKRGTCAKPNGAACTTGGVCASGFCVDGVCCASACAGQCERCDATDALGTCVAAVGPPRAPRSACKGAGVCAGRCDGVVRDACTFPAASTTCAPSNCDRGNETLAAGCDGAGACSTPTTRACAPYVCGLGACKTSCTTDDDCADGTTCETSSGRCVVAAKCDGDHIVTSPDGATKDCTPLRCAGTTCLPDCETSSDCVAGFVCDVATRTCNAAVLPDEGGGCAFGRRESGGVAALLGVLALARRRRR
jgi:hypothetical protein